MLPGSASDIALAEQIAKNLRGTFHQVLGASLAAAPRPVRQTLEVATVFRTRPRSRARARARNVSLTLA